MPRRLIAVVISLTTWAAIGIVVQTQLGWPARYGVHCPPRYCLPNEIWNSGLLLQRKKPLELFFFGWLWSWAAILLTLLVLPIVRKLDEGQS